MVLSLVAAFMIFISILFIFIGLAAPRPADQVQERLTEYAGRPITLEEIELSQPFSERVIKPLIRASAQFVTRFTPQRTIEATRHKLELAGRPFGWGPAEFLGLRGLSAVISAVIPLLLMSVAGTPMRNRLLFAVLLGALGFYLPILWLGRRIRSRQSEVVKALPDVLDLLTICVEAGLGFDAAMSKVSEKWDNELSRAFGRVLAEIRVGKLRREALRDMADRIDVPDVTSFVAAVIQADVLGVSLAKVMRIQSEQMRIKRRQRAEEQAQKAPIKMLIPLTFLVFPAILIVLLGPAFLVLKNSGAMSIFAP